jgi:hypothetical protein
MLLFHQLYCSTVEQDLEFFAQSKNKEEIYISRARRRGCCQACSIDETIEIDHGRRILRKSAATKVESWSDWGYELHKLIISLERIVLLYEFIDVE